MPTRPEGRGRERLRNARGFIFDMDGTLVRALAVAVDTRLGGADSYATCRRGGPSCTCGASKSCSRCSGDFAMIIPSGRTAGEGAPRIAS